MKPIEELPITAEAHNAPQMGVSKFTPNEPQPMAVAAPQGITIQQAFEAAATKSLDKDSLAVMKELLAMDAERKFNIDFVKLQSALPKIVGVRAIPDKLGNTKFEYANFEDIDAIVRPICQEFGFCYSFRETGYENGRVTTTMTLTHFAGHSREIPCTVRIGEGPPGTSAPQNDLGAHTFGKRGALEMGLSLHIVGKRDDVKMEGDKKTKISPQQVSEIQHRIGMLGDVVDMKAFWKYAGADKFSEIPASKYNDIDLMLTRKEKAQ